MAIDNFLRTASLTSLLLTLATTTDPAAAQAAAQQLPLFLDESALELTLEAPLRALRRSARTREEFDAVLRYRDGAGGPDSLEIEVRVRGNSRLAQCDFPPLSLDFPRSQLEGTLFEGQNRLKLVTLCKQQDRYRDYLALEYDIYRLFNRLTDRSFRVRRANVNYVSTDSRREESFTEPAFFIEEDWEVAARHNHELLEIQKLALTDLDPDHTALLSVFQYIIANTDWSALRGPGEEDCCHNGNVFGETGGGAIVIPYDFDQSGLIDTEYSAPSEQLPIRSVTRRYYRGYCALNPQTETAIAYILQQRSALAAVLEDSAASEDAKEDALEFLNESLDILADPEERNEEILEPCRG
ncbi:MAG TPA: hypothetical protein VKQ06_12930 [Gammaproteobacteria bacterium]|nr:hypothetical protein [Gammaproteobacteria bacterium]